MRIAIVTPAGPQLRTGNRVTALRWAKRLRELGARVQVSTQWRDEDADVLVALHASRSAESAKRWLASRADAPLVVGLGGTDVYGELANDRAALDTLAAARSIVALQPLACGQLPVELRSKCRSIVQSAPD
jgi:hypothetical protein